MKILIVDDSKNGALALQMRLLDHGYEEVLIAYSAKEAFTMLGSQPPDEPVQLILMDICMPEMDGIEAIHFLKSHVTYQDIPIVMVSGDEDIERLNQAFSAGAIDFIRKSSEETELIARVKSVLRLKREMEHRKKHEKELQEMTENFKAKAIEAQEANLAKSQFLANMSHEIRTPMNAIVGMTNLAIIENKSPKVNKFLQTVQESAQLLLALLNDILDLSRIESRKLTLEITNFSVRQALEQSLTIFAPKASDKESELIIDIDNNMPEQFIGDPHRFSQILNNLISNAVKFTDKGYISVSAHVLEQHSKKVKIQCCVKDTGVGIKPEDHEKLFQSFTQADSSTTRNFGGTGLGLTICKNLVEMMNGKIWIESQLGKGSQFIFTICFDLPENQPEKTKWFPDQSLLSLNILVVDDNPEAGKALIHVLESVGLSGKWMSDEHLMMDYLNDPKNAPVDLVFLDNSFADTDGFTIANNIRSNPAIHQPELIIMCFLGMDLPENLLQKSGIKAFIHKPLTQRTVVDTIIRVMKPELAENSLQKEHINQFEYENIKLLLVEDNTINISVAEETLRRGNIHDIDIANNGQQAFDMVKKLYQTNTQYDLILMDIQMPVMDGLESTKKIRDYESTLLTMSNQQMKRSLIIAMTAHAMNGYKEICLQTGMDDYIPKPIDLNDLFQKIDKWLPSKRKQIDAYQKNEIDPKNHVNIHIDDSIINVKEAYKRFSSNEDLFFQLLKQFTEEYEHVDQDIQKAIEEQDYKTAHRLAHTIKGLSSNLSAPSLRIASLDLEKALKNKQFDQMKDLFDNFANALNALFSEIKTIINKDKFDLKIFTEMSPQKIKPPEIDKENNQQSDQQTDKSSADTSDAPQAIIQFPQIPEINIQKAFKLFAGNFDLFMQVLKKFYQDYKDFTDKIKEDISSNDLDKVKKKAHTLKGVASYLASDSLLDAAKNLEIYVIEKRYEKIQSIIVTIEGIITQIISSIQRMIQKDFNIEDNILALPQNIHDRFINVYNLLKESDSELKDMIADFEQSLSQFSLSFTARRYLKKMIKEINHYQFDNAQKTFQLLAENCNVQIEYKEAKE
jgi:signal transduction histidine kinase/HPt (histidine-containing phosphotransfer) domain-containing protein